MSARRLVLTLCLLAVIAASPAAAAELAEPSGVIVPARNGPGRLELPLEHETLLTAHSFSFARSFDYCGPMGTTKDVKLREVPVSARMPHPSAVITVIVSFPAYEGAEGPPQPCPPVPYLYETLRVRTKRPAASLRFLDGSYDPPRRIWPEPPGLVGSRWAGPPLGAHRTTGPDHPGTL